MSLLLKNVQIVDGVGEFPQKVDILMRNGTITAIGPEVTPPSGTEVWEKPGTWVSPGWMDVGTHTGDPGYEHREDLEHATAAAAAGGFTAIACFPNTAPALHSKSEVLYVQNKSAGGAVRVHPIGAVSVGCDGKDLAELYDMHSAGAVAFSDGSKPMQDAGFMLRALQYARAFNGLVMNMPQHKSIAAGGQMHEGIVSTTLGLKGIPALAEELLIQRDLSLLAYSGGRLHLHLLSTAKGVAMVRAAKQAGLSVTSSVAVANLCFTDETLRGQLPDIWGEKGDSFDTAWKVLPPLREQSDVDALLEGVLDGTIDFICSNHIPWDEEAKNLEFPYAEFGMETLETAFALCRTFLAHRLPLEVLVEKLALAPRRVLGLTEPVLVVGAKADLTIFNPDLEWVFGAKHLYSKSRNTPAWGKPLRGKPLGIVREGQWLFTP